MRGQEQADPATPRASVPIDQTATVFQRRPCRRKVWFGSPGNIYGRATNPTQEVLEKRIQHRQGGVAALASASGAAAITDTIQALAQAGDHIVAQKTIYGGSYNLLAHTLPQYDIALTFW